MENIEQEVCFQNLKEHVHTLSTQIIQEKIGKKQYNQNEAQNWTNQLCESILKELTKMNKNFKFIVNCLIMQRADCGLNMSGSCFWDNDVDGNVTIKWENQSMIVIINIFACGL
ncbi:hypothetical protein PPERSA_09489 [Pseudocohnilembus persalinus]|uniref:Tctex-1 n=1 Tax=Pseudocohnilembus persalinus TaxID=266149 RepID=A0A0V0QQZ3_PSEPJ|nr:hypothetical protein PPERSA_09489 [Pseudocohnilembus persalinus]|eukprot:KRX04697.1 hypothetical protein PPERSA_09489 [Pseudocohnilembus persalinus]